MQGSPELRIADSEREGAVSVLGEHYAAGRLTKEEFEERADAAWAARTASALWPLFDDLPRLHAGQPVPPPAARFAPPLGPPRPAATFSAGSGPAAWRPRSGLAWLLVVLAALVGLAHLPVVLMALVIWMLLSRSGAHGRQVHRSPAPGHVGHPVGRPARR